MISFGSSFWLGFALVACLAAHGLFALLGALLTRARDTRFAELESSGDSVCRGGRYILQRDSDFLLSSQLGMFFTAFLGGIAGLAFFERGGTSALLSIIALSTREAAVISLLVVGSVVALVFLALVQVIKARAFADPERALCVLALPFLLVSLPLSPFVFALRRILAPTMLRLGVSPGFERDIVLSADEIADIVEKSQKEGAIGRNEGDLLQGVVSFSDTVVREVMVPRKDIVAVEETSSLRDVVRVFLAERLSRLIVIGANLDDVRGVLLLKDLLPVFARGGAVNFALKDFIRPAYFVPNTRKIDYLLQAMRKDGIHLAVVLDEHGGVDGLVTIEDLIEEIVGEISDEYDAPGDEIEVYKTKSGDLLADGSMLIEDLNSAYGFKFPLGEYDTIAGMLVHTLGRIPQLGESIESEGFSLRVEKIGQNRITLVRISQPKKSAEAAVFELHPDIRNHPKDQDQKPGSEPDSKKRIQGRL